MEMKRLVIAPHPDDEVLGCGGTIAKCAKAGEAVHLCIVTEAYTPDWSEEYIENRKRCPRRKPYRVVERIERRESRRQETA